MNDFVFALTLTPGSGKKFRQRIYFITRTIRNENKNKKKSGRTRNLHLFQLKLQNWTGYYRRRFRKKEIIAYTTDSPIYIRLHLALSHIFATGNETKCQNRAESSQLSYNESWTSTSFARRQFFGGYRCRKNVGFFRLDRSNIT